MNSAHITFDQVEDKVAQRVRIMRSSAVRDLFSAASRPDIISLSGGMPDVSLLPKEAVQIAAAAAVKERSVALQYGTTDGSNSLKAVIKDLVRDTGIRCQTKNLILTSGAQEALDLLGKCFIDPGDIILAEGPTYLGALQAFSAYQPDVRCIDFDDDGMQMDLLEQELQSIGKGNPRLKLCYVIPNFQNPGGVTMSQERRRRLIELSHEYGFLIIEDDPYGRLRYEGGHRLPLKALDDNVIYLSTMSKIFAPGLRLGWVIANTDVISKLNLVKQGTDLCGSSFDQVMIEHYFTDTDWERVLQGFIKTYRSRRDAMLKALDEYFPSEATWTKPAGGFFVWVTLPSYVDTGSMLGAALASGVTYVPGDSFYPDGVRGRNCMRINFSYETEENITEAIRRLAEVIEDRLCLYRAFLSAGAIEA